MKKLFKLLPIIFLFASCTEKEAQEILANVNVSFGFKIAGQMVTVSLGNGSGYYYDQQYYDTYQAPPQGSTYYNNNTNVTVCYIVSKPTDQTRIIVCDQYGHPIATVSLNTGSWQQDNYLFQQLQAWNYNAKPCKVLVEWSPKWTTGPWDGKIRG